MNVHQSIYIHTIKIGSITNSSVLQIGTSGIITPVSHLYNTGGFTAPAEEIATENTIVGESLTQPSLVPL